MTIVLSIQSHVTVGAVGNSAAVFALQRMGVETWGLPTVVLSNDNSRDHVAGPALSASQLRGIVDAMTGNGVLGRVDALLSGYLTAETGPVVLETAARLKELNPSVLYCCDPVMGDEDKGFYVPPEVRRFFGEEAVGACDVLTPNLFELGALTGSRPETLTEVVDAARQLVDAGPATVLVTSVVCRDLPGDRVHMVAVERDRAVLVSTPMLEAVFDGSGDLTTAVFLANRLGGADLSEALGRTAASVHGVLRLTARMGRREPALVAGQDLLVDAPAVPAYDL
ncbi:pyridoxal kinase [Acidipropionibacterium acidipropionici]|uniref:pyridoxal kinase n=1 Tax=Acidipropionibacterium acidipropionici TaxID=1748 RepID=UPI00041C8632|nr:pyridoxal kinase [Acidipropionibacterium acidipropionici]ALN16041.1 hypothetical protein ASQ49_13090 [Acidipropionibacterium acidipropionici]APZ08207.1 pyridoxal kinase [Acidipropionibacterium acidipropionici]